MGGLRHPWHEVVGQKRHLGLRILTWRSSKKHKVLLLFLAKYLCPPNISEFLILLVVGGERWVGPTGVTSREKDEVKALWTSQQGELEGILYLVTPLKSAVNPERKQQILFLFLTKVTTGIGPGEGDWDSGLWVRLLSICLSVPSHSGQYTITIYKC